MSLLKYVHIIIIYYFNRSCVLICAIVLLLIQYAIHPNNKMHYNSNTRNDWDARLHNIPQEI